MVMARVIARLAQSGTKLRNRYGARYAYAMLAVVFFTFWLPVPGSSLVGVALIMIVAEAHRVVPRREGLAEAVAGLLVLVDVNKPFWARGLGVLPFGRMEKPAFN